MRLREKRAKVRELWLDRQPENKRSANDVLIFYGWLERNWPELLTTGHGDPLKHLKADLAGLWKD
jgi:hypothetical protein